MSNASSALSLKMSLGLSGAKKSRRKSGSMYLRACLFAFGGLCVQLAFAAPFDYVANFGADTVSVIDTSTNTVVDTVPAASTTPGIGVGPLGVAINPAGTFVYVANYTGSTTSFGTVSVVDTSTNSVTATVEVGLEPELLAVTPDGASVYVANLLGNTVSVIDTATNTQTAKFNVGGYPAAIAINPSGKTVYATLSNLSKVAVIDTASNTVSTNVTVGVNPIGIVINPAGTFVYVTNYGSDSISVIDTSSNAVVATVPIVCVADSTPVVCSPNGIAINPAGTFIYVSNLTDDTVAVISTATNSVVASVPVGVSPLGISIDSNGTYAYVNNSQSETVSIIDLSVNVVTGTISVGTQPTYSAITSSAGVSVKNLDQHGLTGTWYNPSTSGQGFMIEVYPDTNGIGQGVLSAGWFTFDVTAAGGQRWYTLQGDVSSTSSTAALTIYTDTGGNFNAAPTVSATQVGQATLKFTDCTHGLLNYTFSDGSNRAGTIPLVRATANTTCSTNGDNGAAASDYLLSGGWYNPSTSGQGFMFDINPKQSVLSAAWYTYSPTGAQTGGGASQRWYTIQTHQFAAGATSMNNIPIYATTGGVFDDPTPATTAPVGTANIAFQSCSAMTLAYTFTSGTNQGLSGTINLSRPGPTPAGCSL